MLNPITLSVPLTEAGYEDLFKAWARVNRGPLKEMEYAALRIHRKRGCVSSKYLIERQRYEGKTPVQPVVYVDQYGGKHLYTINNNITPYLARYLLAKHPTLHIETRKIRHK